MGSGGGTVYFWPESRSLALQAPICVSALLSLCCMQDVVRLEQQLHDLMARMTRVRLQARYFSLPEEYQPNPHFNPLQALTLQALLGTPVAGGGVDDSPAPGTGGPRAAGTPVAGSAGAHPPPVPPGMGPNSEAVDMD
jgi:hypothetical protein